MDVERASAADTVELVALRVAYLTEDNGALDKSVEDVIKAGLQGYFGSHLGRDLHVYVPPAHQPRCRLIRALVWKCSNGILLFRPVRPLTYDILGADT